MNNGASLWWRSGNHSIAAEKRAEMYIDFFVDVNGSALPNMVGKDVFDFYYENKHIDKKTILINLTNEFKAIKNYFQIFFIKNKFIIKR